MKGRYIRIATRFWTDEKVIELDPISKLLYLYMLSCPHSNMAGYYRLPKEYIVADLKLLPEQLDKAFGKLLSKGLIKHCEKSSVVLIPNYYKYNNIQNVNQAKGAAARTSELPKNSLVEDYKQAINAYAGSYKEQLGKGLPKGFDKWLPEGFGNTESESESESDISNSCSDSEPSPNDDQDGTEGEKSEDRSKYPEDSRPYKAACYLRRKILANNKRTRVPDETPEDMEDWSTEMDRLNRLGPVGAKEGEDKGYTWKEIKALVDWCQDNDFWKSNILSAGKFREKIVQLENKMKSRSSPGKSNIVNLEQKNMSDEEKEEYYRKKGYR